MPEREYQTNFNHPDTTDIMLESPDYQDRTMNLDVSP